MYQKNIWLLFSENNLDLYKEIYEKNGTLSGAITREKEIKEPWTLKRFPIFCDVNDSNKIYSAQPMKAIFNEKLQDLLIGAVQEAHEIAKLIKDQSSNYGEKEEGAVSATVFSLMNSWSYNENYDNFTFLDLAAELLYAIACRHKFRDGNKRTALLSAILILKMSGFSLKTEQLKLVEQWDDFMVRIVEEHVEIPENIHINQIKEKLKEELLIKI
ncbi:type II toxin-antitoxin system death-on-curing family toxin [Mesoplasma photuris]|uniref:type II toxin-antitoxin system death-on-curing family toxin n=1 Tax=Mesoplasma photuris TaxID=217731 RepID=UPI0004E170C4|nr:Fic family protein [Mesoplasma photuris]